MNQPDHGRVVIFAYNFPHKKTQDVLQRLIVTGSQVQAVIAADPVPLNIPKSRLRIKPRFIDLLEPRDICRRFQIPYFVIGHRSRECVSLLASFQPSVGVIAGARILPAEVIEQFSVGIVNFHPGLLPQVRGLDALQWAVYDHLPIGVTAHLIDHRVDAGRIIQRRTIEEFSDDSLVDLSLRLHETQIQMLPRVLEQLRNTPLSDLEPVGAGECRRSFPDELTPVLMQCFAGRRHQDARAA